MSEDYDYHLNKAPGKTYISRRIIVHNDKKLRHASKVLDLDEGFIYAKEKDELVIRKTDGGRKEIIAKFFEDPRGLSVVTIQSFNPTNGQPQKTYFSFVGSEIGQIINFFNNVHQYEFQNANNINITDFELKKIILNQNQARTLVKDNQDLFVEAFKDEVTSEDVVAIGFRKRQLETFSRLLEESEYFEYVMHAKNCQGKENVWQKFFDKNKWIFGYGLNYILLSGFEDKQLEQIVFGNDFVNRGKRVDALMKTKGVISSLCFVEIKTHLTDLLENNSYRPGCWAPSRELVGAVSQIQTTIALASRNLYDRITPVGENGDPTGEEVFNYKPKAFIVIGNLQEFVTPNGINKEKLRSFELYRTSLKDVEILTFDELYERARFIVAVK